MKVLALGVLALAGCATLEPQQRPPETRTITVEVKTPVPVPCFTEADRPVLPALTTIDIDHATVDQMAAALAADEANEILYRTAVDALFMACLKTTGGTK
jgi:hypothetical protein